MDAKAWQIWISLGLFSLTFPFALAGGEGSWISLWPSLLALSVVLLTQRVLFGLFLGAIAGVLLLTGGDPLAVLPVLLVDHLFPNFQSSWRLGAIAFTLLLGGFAALLEHGRGLEAFVSRRLARSKGDVRKQFQFSSMGLGFICFFDGLANSMLIGSVTRKLAGKVGVSRVRMAYLVDSTSSAVACLAFISTWITFQLSLIEQGLADVGRSGSPYVLFFQSIPLNYYCLFTLFLLGLSIAFDFVPGPMRKFERRARASHSPESLGAQTGAPSTDLRAAAIPLAVLVGAIMGAFMGFYWLESGTFQFGWTSLARAFSTSYGAEALVVGSLVGVTAAILCYPRQPADAKGPLSVFVGGMATLLRPIFILIVAWILGSTLSSLGTAETLSHALSGKLPYALLPTVVFLTGALISFSTGTSWGTMGILMPLALPAVFVMGDSLGIHNSDQMAMLAACIGAVFSGAVFGDHCSPFSDTTIISSIACEVDPADHVKTQLPFALIAAGVAVGAGFIPAGLGLPGWAGVALGLLILVGGVVGSGRRFRP